MQLRHAFLWITAAGLYACTIDNSALAPEAHVQFAQRVIAQEWQKQYDRVQDELDATLQTPGARAELIALGFEIPLQAPLSSHLANSRRVVTRNGTVSDLSFEYEYPYHWLLVQIATCDRQDQIRICGLHIRSLPDSLEHLHAFTLRDKGFCQYALFVAAIVLPLVLLYTVWLCLNEQNSVRKWIWAVAIACGLGHWSVNWNDGYSSMHWLTFQFLGADISRADDGQIQIGVSIPVAALWYYFIRYRERFFGTRRTA